MSATDFKLQQKIARLIMMSAPRIQNFRKPEKFSLGASISESEYKLLELCIRGNKTRGSKRPFQNDMDIELDVLRSYIDLSVMPELRLISPGLHKVWSNEINEIGAMLGAWIKVTL